MNEHFPGASHEGYDPDPIMKHFDYRHLQSHLAVVSKPFHDLAEQVDQNLPDGPEKSVALRKLLEAKDAAVRALI